MSRVGWRAARHLLHKLDQLVARLCTGGEQLSDHKVSTRWLAIGLAMWILDLRQCDERLRHPAESSGGGVVGTCPADSSCTLHADHSPLYSFKILVEAALERAEAGLSNVVSTSVWELYIGCPLASKSRPEMGTGPLRRLPGVLTNPVPPHTAPPLHHPTCKQGR